MRTKRSKQLSLLPTHQRFFGGALLYRHRKSQRPISSKDPVHLVMRSSWARGRASFLRPQHRRAIDNLIKACGRKYGVRIYRVAIAPNHVHLIARPHNRACYNAFVRVLTGQIASLVMGGLSFEAFLETLRGDALHTTEEPQGKEQRFWQFRPFSRVLHWGRDYRTCCAYLLQNTLEAMGFIKYKARTRDLYAKLIHESIAVALSKTG